MGRFFCTYFSLFLLLLLSVSEVQGQLNATFTSTDQSQCPGNLFVLNANNPTYSNYAWTIAGPNGFNSSLSGSSIVVFLNNFGNYSVTLTVSDAGFTTTNTQNNFLEVYSPPTISYTISSTSGCAPLAVNFNGSSIPGSGSFQSFAINSANGTISNTEDFSIIYSSAGIYNPTATVTNSFGCFTTMNLPAISVLPAPSLTSPLNSNIICSGSTFNYSFSSSISGTTYTWARASVPGISPNASSGLGNINEILVNNTSNNIIVPYVITSTAPNGCVGIQTINVLVRVLPTVSANTTNIDICQGQTTNLTATGSTQNGQYLWSTGEETSSIMVDASGVYSVTFNNGICTSLPLNINVNTIAAPVVNLTNSENSGLANNDAIICAGASIQLTANPVLAGGSYLWMPGNLNTQSITVSPSSSIAYTLVYSLGCPSIADTIAVLVNNLPINSYTASTSNACSAPVTTAFTSTTLNANNALTTWSFPGASSPISGIGAGPIAVTYNNSGNYSISMTTTSLDGCVSTATFPNAITVGNGAPPSSSFVNLTAVTQCVNADNFCFQYTGVGADTILLDFGNGITDFFDPTVSYCYSYPALGNYTVSMTPFTTVGNAVGCSGSTSQLNVVVTGPQAIFTISPVVCSNQLTRSFNSISAGTSPSTVYTWNFGDGSPNSSLQAVTHTFPSFGSFTVNLTVSDVLTGCLPNSYQVVVHANPNNLANFQSNLSGVLTQDVCLGTTLQFVNTTPAPQYNSGVLPASNTSNNTQWDWNTNNGIVFSTAINSLRGTPRTRIFSSPVYSPGNYGVAMLNIDNNGCRDTVIKTIQVHGVIGTFSVSDTVCTGLSFSANDNSSSPIGSIVSRVWSWGDGTPNTAGNIANPTHIYAASGSYLITLTVTDDFGCTKTSTKVVVVRKPFASFNVDQDFICNNQSIVVSPNAFGVGTLNYSWSATSANPLSAVGSTPAPFTFVQQGNQTISLTVSDNLGCTDDTLIPITVLNVSAAAVASGNSFACFNPPNVVSFTNTSLNNPDINSAQWDFGNGQTSTNWNPSTVYSLPGTYNVSLVVSSMPTSSGAVCRDTQQVVIINIGGPNGSLDVTNLNLTSCSCYLASIDVNTSGATEAKLLFGNGAFVDLIPNTSQTVTYSYCNTGTTQIQFVPSLFLSNGACFGYIPSLDTIRIQPTPTVNNLANQIICANSNTNTVNFSSTVLNTSFSWTNSNPTIGLAATGTGSISSFFAQNNTSNQQNATINVTPIANGCPGNPVTFTYSVNALATISAGIDQTICGTSTANLAGTQGGATTSVTWSGGTGTFSPNATTLNAVYTPSAAEVSAGSVTLTLTSNDPTGPCTAVSDQVLITINQPATVNAGIDQTICGTAPVSLSGTQGGVTTSVTWSGGTGTFSPNASTLNAIYTPSAADVTAGLATLTLTSNNPAGPCPSVTDQVLITIAQPPTVSAGIDQSICGTSTVSLAGTQGGATTSVTWSGVTGTYSPNASTLNAVYTPSAAEVSAGSVTLILSSNDPTGPCTAVSDQVLITINQPATVNAGIDQTICGTAPVSLSGTQGGATTSVTWSGGTGTFSPNASTLNAIYTPSAADVTAGLATLTLTSDDPIGPCAVATDQILITINALPIIVGQDTVVLCTGDNLNYPIVTDVASNVSWFGTNNPDVGGETLPVQNTSFIGDNLVNATNNIQYVLYSIDLTSLINGCQSANQRLIAQVNPLPVIDSIGDLFYCDGVVTSPVILGSNLLNTNFLWTNSNSAIGLAASGTGDIPAFTPNNNSIADITANITVFPENSGCLGNSFSFNITIGPIPNVNVSPAGPYCVSSPSENLVVDVVNGFWSGPGIVNQVTGEFDPSFANVGINVISYSLNGVCGGGSSIDILVYPNPAASFTVDNFSTSVLDPVFHFENTSVNATAYTWNFGNGTSSNVENPTQTYPEVIGYYLVELIATNNSGCVDTVSNFVYVEEETIFYVPNSFTPDGNEVNNVFQPVFSEGYDSDFYSLRIFNRWGEVVFETTEVLEGWDGTYKGYLSPDGTYVWSISFKAATTDFVYRYEGHVTLIR